MADFLHCAREIKGIVGRDLTEPEAERLEAALAERSEYLRRTNAGLSQTESIVRAAEDISTEQIALQIAERRITALNHIKLVSNLDYIERVWSDNSQYGLQALIGGLNVLRRGSRDSVMNAQQALSNHYMQGLATELRDKGILAAAQDSTNGEHLAVALFEIRKKEPKLDGIPKEVVEAAKVIEKWTDLSRRDANAAGAYIAKAQDFIAYQAHDMYKLRNAAAILVDKSASSPKVESNRTAWKNYVRSMLDERTYKDVDAETIAKLKPGQDRAKAIQEAREEFLTSVYDALSTGLHFKNASKDTTVGATGERSMAKRMSEGRLLIFQDAKGWYEYQSKFGQSDILNNIAVQLGRRAENVALMRQFGPNPERVFERLKTEAQKIARKGEEFDTIDAAKSMGTVDALWNQVSGEARVPGNATVASWGYMARAIHSMSKLGTALLSAFGDTAGAAAELRYQGMSLTDQWGTTLNSVVSGYGGNDRVALLSSMGVALDWIRSSVSRRFDTDDGIPGRMTNMLNTFFKLNGLTWWTDTLKGGVALGMNHFVARQAGNAFDQLDEGTARVFQLFGIEQSHWNAARRYMLTSIDGDGRTFIDPQLAKNISDGFIIDQLKAKGLNPTDYRITEFRREVESKFRSYFADRADFAVLTPDARTRSIMNMGTQPGTVIGEVVRAVMMFKSFPIAVLQKTVGRELYGYHANAAWNPFRERSMGNMEMMGLVQFVATSTILGYMAMEAKSLLRGQEPLKPDTPQEIAKVIGAAMVQGGGMGILGDFLIGQASDRYGRSGLASFLGPQWAAFEDMYSVYTKLRGGDTNVGFLLNRLLSHVPYQNLFYLRTALNYGILYNLQEMTSPGSLSKMEQRMEQNSGRKFMFPPSQYGVGVR
jgi:hypothetical protein